MELYLRRLIATSMIIAIFTQASPQVCVAEDQKQLSGYEIYESQFVPTTRGTRREPNSLPRKQFWLSNESIEIANATSPEDAFQKFLKRYGKEKGIPDSLDNFQLTRNKTSDINSVVTVLSYQQVFKKLPVFDSGFGASIIQKNGVYQISRVSVTEFRIPETLEIPQNPDPEAAIRAAAEAIRRSYVNPPDKIIFGEGEGSEPRPELGIIEYKGPARVAWHMIVYSKNPPGAQWKIFIDAITNEVISINNITVVD